MAQSHKLKKWYLNYAITIFTWAMVSTTLSWRCLMYIKLCVNLMKYKSLTLKWGTDPCHSQFHYPSLFSPFGYKKLPKMMNTHSVIKSRFWNDFCILFNIYLAVSSLTKWCKFVRVVKCIFVTCDWPIFFPVKCETTYFFLMNRDFHSSCEAWFGKLIFPETRNKCLIRPEPCFSLCLSFVNFDNSYYVINYIAWPWRHSWSLLRQERGWSGVRWPFSCEHVPDCCPAGRTATVCTSWKSRTNWIFKGSGTRRHTNIKGPWRWSALLIRWRLIRQRFWWFCRGRKWCHSWYAELFASRRMRRGWKVTTTRKALLWMKCKRYVTFV